MRRSFGPVAPPLVALTMLRIVASTAGALLVGPQACVVVCGFQFAVLALSTYGLWIEPFRLGLTVEYLRSPLLDPAAPPARILHISDLHLERASVREESLLRLIEEARPDVILFSGDFVNLSYRDDPISAASINEMVRQWAAAGRVFAVSGSPLVESHDRVASFLHETGARWLQDEAIEIEVNGQWIVLLGLTCSHEVQADTQRLVSGVASRASDRFAILLYHSPDIAPAASQWGIDLYLCGHTHGGQIRLPFIGALITSSARGKQYEMGRYRVGSMTLYVSRGVGLEGAAAPRARLLCPPEITLWILSGEN